MRLKLKAIKMIPQNIKLDPALLERDKGKVQCYSTVLQYCGLEAMPNIAEQ